MSTPVCFLYAGYYRKADPVEEHQHNGVEAIYIRNGSCITRIGKDKYACRRGDVCVIPSGTPHDQEDNSADIHTEYIIFTQPAGQSLTLTSLLHSANDLLIRHWFADIVALFAANFHAEAEILLGLLLKRLQLLGESMHDLQQFPPALTRALKHIHLLYRENLSIHVLELVSQVSTTYLNNLFRQAFHTSTAQYLTQVRMSYARQLLMNRYYQVAEIAHLVGYEDSDYFCRRFKAFHGISPLTYRKFPTRYSSAAENRKHLFLPQEQAGDLTP